MKRIKMLMRMLMHLIWKKSFQDMGGFEAQAAELDKTIGQSSACTAELRYLKSDDILIMEKRYQAR